MTNNFWTQQSTFLHQFCSQFLFSQIVFKIWRIKQIFWRKNKSFGLKNKFFGVKKHNFWRKKHNFWRKK